MARRKRAREASSSPSGLGPLDWLAERTWARVALVAALAIGCYSNTLDMPFQWDDTKWLVKGNVIEALAELRLPDELTPREQHTFWKRAVAFVTFGLNHRLHGTEVRGYHVVNIAIHASMALLVHALVVLLFRTPALAASSLQPHRATVALVAAALFACHPLHVSCVTYIYQRLASLMAAFYVASVVGYLLFRVEDRPRVRHAAWAMALLAAVLAMLTKENAFTLPVALILVELAFFTGPWKPRLVALVPFLSTMLILPSIMASLPAEVAGKEDGLAGALLPSASSPLHYLYTQFGVLVHYLRMLVLPVDQALVSDAPLATSLFQAGVLLPLVLLVALLAAGLFLLHRGHDETSHLRLVGGGIVWFFLTHSVESSIVPLQHVMQEYRMYLSSVGLFGAAGVGFALLLRWSNTPRARWALLGTLVASVVALSAATRARNEVWSDPVIFWADAVAKAPRHPSAHYNLANQLKRAGRQSEAITHYERAIELSSENAEARVNLGNVLLSRGDVQGAEMQYREALKQEPDRWQALVGLGAVLVRGNAASALEPYLKALELHPSPANQERVGTTYLRLRRHADALPYLQQAVAGDPGDARAQGYLGDALRGTGAAAEAEERYRQAVALNPSLGRAWRGLGLAQLDSGRPAEAITSLEKALELRPGDASARRSLQRARRLASGR